MDFKNLKFSLDTKRIEKTEPVTATPDYKPWNILSPDYKPWNILSPDYLEESFPLHVSNAAMIFFTYIGADDRCGCDICLSSQPRYNEDRVNRLYEMQQISLALEGKCMATCAGKFDAEIEFECKRGHRFHLTYNRLKQQHAWCSECRDKIEVYELLKRIAQSYGGDLLSSEYKDSRLRLRWRCIDGHEWDAIPQKIKSGESWCPYCNGFDSQERSRCVFDALTGGKFIKTRDVIGSELDGYCDKFKVAFEYQGQQHYRQVPFFHKTAEDFKNQQARDAEKRVRCKDGNIILIEVPYTKSVDNETLSQFIYNELVAHNIPVIKKPEDINFEGFRVGQSKLAELRKFASGKGGWLLTNVYVDMGTDMLWRCEHGHEWWATSRNVKLQDTWCPDCNPCKRLTIEHMYACAALKEGFFMSTEYTNSTTPYLWKCKFGHTWEATASSIQQDSWCPHCLKLSIEEMQQIAASKDGKCRSTEYVNSFTPLEWECHLGHTWWAKPCNVKHNNSWCPHCDPTRQKTIEDMNVFAASKGGKFLSPIYKTGKDLHLWECDCGHQFEGRYDYLRLNKWFCQTCKKIDNEKRQMEKKVNKDLFSESSR